MTKLSFRTAHANKKLLDVVLSLLDFLDDKYGRTSVFLFAGLFSDEVNKAVKDTGDPWISSMLRSNKSDFSTASLAGVIVASVYQYHNEDFYSFITDKVILFDKKYHCELFDELVLVVPDSGAIIAPEFSFALEKDDVMLLLSEISICFNKRALLWLLSCCPIKSDKTNSVFVAALMRLRDVSPDDYFDFCVIYKDQYIEVKAIELAHQNCKLVTKSKSDLSISSSTSLPIRVWQVVRQGLDEIYNSSCPDAFRDEDMIKRIDRKSAIMVEDALLTYKKNMDAVNKKFGVDGVSDDILANLFTDKKDK